MSTEDYSTESNPTLRYNGPEVDPNDPNKSIASAWDRHRFNIKMVNPANKRKYNVIVVGTGLAGASAAATLGELGYNVINFCFQDSPRRAHSIAAQGGINAAKNYQNDGDSVYRLFYDTVKGGDFRSREANVYRLAQVSVNIIDQAVAQGVPFGREYGGLLANRSFGGALVSRTFYAKGQTGQQLLLGAYQAHSRMVDAGKITMKTRTEMLDLVLVDGEAKGIIVRNLVSGEIESYAADCVVLATGGYSNVFFLSTNAMGCNVTSTWRASRRGAFFANPCYTQIHPTCIPQAGDYQSKLTLMSESLRNDGRVWVPKTKELAEQVRAGTLKPKDIKEEDRDYYLERIYPTFGNLVPRDVASRAAKRMCDDGKGVAQTERGYGVFLDFKDAIERDGEDAVRARYGNLFEMYERITDDNPYETPMRIYPAPHYTMGGLWVDYNLMSNVPGLFVIGEANFSDHGANRLGASALMQGLADGYFILPYTIGHYLAQVPNAGFSDVKHPEFIKTKKEAIARLEKLLNVNGDKSCDVFHRDLGYLMLDKVGMSRDKEGLEFMLKRVREIREDFWKNVSVPGTADALNPSLEKANRVADFLEFAEVMVYDALTRSESCGGHFREESQTEEGEAKRDDEQFCHVAAWEYRGPDQEPIRHTEELKFDYVIPSQRSYK